ncbi:MAG: NAD(P)-dependent oxidoreductase [Bacteroidota bacterium]
MTTHSDLLATLATPSPALVDYVREINGPLVVLGAGGKMGPSLCMRAAEAARKAGVSLRVIAVSRFSDVSARKRLEDWGIETWAADVMDPEAELPDAGDVVYLVGRKFGTGRDPGATWLANTVAPTYTMQRYAGHRFVALSTGNVYPFFPAGSNGPDESEPLAPIGEYAYACLARERVIDSLSRQLETPSVLVRLNYAVDLRYGVLVDLGRRLLDGAPVDVTTPALNCIWQGDANDAILRAFQLADVPARPLNLTGPKYHTRDLAKRLAERLDLTPTFAGTEADSALLSDASLYERELGPPEIDIDTMLDWTAAWLQAGNELWDKPTHFQARDGKF